MPNLRSTLEAEREEKFGGSQLAFASHSHTQVVPVSVPCKLLYFFCFLTDYMHR